MFDEPPIQPGDTRPTVTVPTIDPEAPARGGSRVVGLLSLLGTFGFVLATITLLLTNSGGAPSPSLDDGQTIAEALPTASPIATSEQPTGQPVTLAAPTPQIIYTFVEALPTMDGSQLVSLLAAPVEAVDRPNPYALERDGLDPFTIIPDRPRNRVIEYVIQRGDTVSEIALRFGLDQNSIAWSNDRRRLWTLIPGEILLIPPVDGVAHEAVGDDTVAEIADYYGLDDPYIIIDSDFNNLQGYTPDMQLPSGLRVFVPGGRGEEINWAPPVVQGSSSGGSSGSGAPANTVSLPAGPGSCGAQPLGPSSGWQRPLGGYTITRGYADWHPGIDLAAAEGTAVMAANTGRVIFAGWSTWGYGYTVALSHGPFITLYGHLSAVSVGCGQIVGIGQTIGAVGSTGNSSGPHLHFEIIYNTVRGNPAATIPF
jgi:murein DD-endopeptidase MepM/ murein hydrolase activator NlpD